MVEMKNNPQQEKGTTPATITVSMVLEDLDNGIDRTGIKVKYDLQAWEVKQMFDHPSLKGRKAKRVKKLSFNFIDDTNPDVLPGQVDLIDAIEEELEGRQQMDAQDQLQEAMLDEDTSDQYTEEDVQEFGTSEQISEIEHDSSIVVETKYVELEDRADTYNEQDY